MNDKESVESTRTDPVSPEEIVSMTAEERDGLLALPPNSLDAIFPGFLSGGYLHRYYKPQLWIPAPDLTDAMLFAGKGSFEGLQEYTYERLQDSSGDVTTALQIVERFMSGIHRRTGEPGIAHIYRTYLRTNQFMKFCNEMYGQQNSLIHFSDETREIMELTSILHDFSEDEIDLSDSQKRIGITKAVYDALHQDRRNSKFFLRSAIAAPRYKRLKSVEDTALQLEPQLIPYLENALAALKSNHVEPNLIMKHLLQQISQHDRFISIFSEDHAMLTLVPMFIKTVADRPDNLDTYFFSKTIGGTIPTSYEYVTKKANENLVFFNEAELSIVRNPHQLLIDGDYFNNSEQVSPSSLPFFPSRWSKLVLLGLNPNQMYRVPEDGGLPELI